MNKNLIVSSADEKYFQLLKQLYNYTLKRRTILWDTQKNIEAEEKWAQKKEEHVKEIKENKP